MWLIIHVFLPFFIIEGKKPKIYLHIGLATGGILILSLILLVMTIVMFVACCKKARRVPADVSDMSGTSTSSSSFDSMKARYHWSYSLTDLNIDQDYPCVDFINKYFICCCCCFAYKLR